MDFSTHLLLRVQSHKPSTVADGCNESSKIQHVRYFDAHFSGGDAILYN